jgi:hypothetical protein
LVTLPVAAGLLCLTVPLLVGAFNVSMPMPSAVNSLAGYAEPFRIANPYGLFAVMTTMRPEIVIEGSEDGVTWKPYEFKWKPGNVNRRPEFTTPHMSRLDWQMWFAALGDVNSNPWMILFLQRLQEGSPAVLRLMGSNPFPGHPPKMIRAVLYDYKMTDFGERRATGAWWKRTETGIYFEMPGGP